MRAFESLSSELKPWTKKPLSNLPNDLRTRVQLHFVDLPWDSCTPDKHRQLARWWDFNNDPTTAESRESWDAHFERRESLSCSP